MTLALKYRPKAWADLVGQEVNVKILTAMLRRNHRHPFFIFSGPRGVGKTTAARILAKALNCTDPIDEVNPCGVCDACVSIESDACPDVIELDAASNGGVQSVRRIRELSLYRPIQVTNRVIILDEAHAMTREAFQALLKILEEPPDYMTFVMATTEVHAIPDTIISRAFPFEFRRISAIDIYRRISHIAKVESLSITDAALRTISIHVSGGLRDAITVMEQVCSQEGEVQEDDAVAVLGVLVRSEIAKLFDHLISHERAQVFLWTNTLIERGIEPTILLGALLGYVRDLMACLAGYRGDLNDADYTVVSRQSRELGPTKVLYLANELMELEARASRSPVPVSILVDLTLSRLATQLSQNPN